MIELLSKKFQVILGAVDKLQVVYNHEREDALGTPFATITPSANESAYNTTTENDRVYAFLVRIFVQRKAQTTVEDCEQTMRLLVDDVLDALDRNHRLSGLGTKTGYTYLFMEAAPSAWGYVGRENEYRVAEVNVRVHFSVDVNFI